MPFKRFVRTLFIAVLLAGLVLAAQPAHAESFTVGCDVNALRTAINMAQAFPGPDILNLAPGCVYNLPDSVTDSGWGTGAGLPEIITEIVIEGNGATIQRDPAGGDFRLFLVTSNGHLTLNNLTLQNGLSPIDGGAIVIALNGYLELNDTVVRDNTTQERGGAIYAQQSSQFVINNSQFINNRAEAGRGGAIYLNQLQTSYISFSMITNSLFDGNAAGYSGGAIFQNHYLDIRDSTFVNNHADLIPVNDHYYGGGALIVDDGSRTLVFNSTFSGNSTINFGGAIQSLFPPPASLFLAFVTITGNIADSDSNGIGAGGGVSLGGVSFNPATVSSIIAGNDIPGTGYYATYFDDCYGRFNTFSWFNLIGNNTAYIVDPSTNQSGTHLSPLDPGLGPLADNGCAVPLPDGSCVGTHALLTGSPAIDMGCHDEYLSYMEIPSFDQRGSGFPRMLDGGSGTARIDIGAYEYGIPTPYDYGDAPDPQVGTVGEYPTLLANDGARHTRGSGLYLGTVDNVDGEADGQQSATADGDDAYLNDDEDGITFTTTLMRGSTTANVQADVGGAAASCGGAAYLHGWIDFNADGDWADAGEQIIDNSPVGDGINNRTFTVPAAAAVGTTFARFRIQCASGALGVTGLADDGEVEDYQVTIMAPHPLMVMVMVIWPLTTPA